MTTQFYNNKYPKKNDMILITFNEHKDAIFNGKCIEYTCDVMMSESEATKKKTVWTWKEIVPLKKNLVVLVEDIDKERNLVIVSMAYLMDHIDEKVDSPKDIQKVLIDKFKNNRILEGIIKKICVINNYDFETYWKDNIHIIDKKRQKSFTKNLDIYEWIIQNINDKSIDNKIKNIIQDRIKPQPEKLITKVGIVSPNGISRIKQILKDIIYDFNFEFKLYYDTAPNYVFETIDVKNETNINKHTQFINKLNNHKDIFVKIILSP